MGLPMRPRPMNPMVSGMLVFSTHDGSSVIPPSARPRSALTLAFAPPRPRTANRQHGEVRPARHGQVRQLVQRRGAARVRARHGAAALVRVRSGDRRLPGGRETDPSCGIAYWGMAWRSGATRLPPASSRRRSWWRPDATSPRKAERPARRPRASAITSAAAPRSTTSDSVDQRARVRRVSRRDGRVASTYPDDPRRRRSTRCRSRSAPTRPTRPTRTS